MVAASGAAALVGAWEPASVLRWDGTDAKQELMHQRDSRQLEIAWMSGFVEIPEWGVARLAVVRDILVGGYVDRFMPVFGYETGELIWDSRMTQLTG